MECCALERWCATRSRSDANKERGAKCGEVLSTKTSMTFSRVGAGQSSRGVVSRQLLHSS
jgi:hypothetical protein